MAAFRSSAGGNGSSKDDGDGGTLPASYAGLLPSPSSSRNPMLAAPDVDTSGLYATLDRYRAEDARARDGDFDAPQPAVGVPRVTSARGRRTRVVLSADAGPTSAASVALLPQLPIPSEPALDLFSSSELGRQFVAGHEREESVRRAGDPFHDHPLLRSRPTTGHGSERPPDTPSVRSSVIKVPRAGRFVTRPSDPLFPPINAADIRVGPGFSFVGKRLPPTAVEIRRPERPSSAASKAPDGGTPRSDEEFDSDDERGHDLSARRTVGSLPSLRRREIDSANQALHLEHLALITSRIEPVKMMKRGGGGRGPDAEGLSLPSTSRSRPPPSRGRPVSPGSQAGSWDAESLASKAGVGSQRVVIPGPAHKLVIAPTLGSPSLAIIGLSHVDVPALPFPPLPMTAPIEGLSPWMPVLLQRTWATLLCNPSPALEVRLEPRLDGPGHRLVTDSRLLMNSQPLRSLLLHCNPVPVDEEEFADTLQRAPDDDNDRPLELWNERWEAVSERIRAWDPLLGGTLCGCGCGQTWGAHRVTPRHVVHQFALEDSDKRHVSWTTQHAGLTDVLALHPGGPDVGQPSPILDLRAWSVRRAWGDLESAPLGHATQCLLLASQALELGEDRFFHALARMPGLRQLRCPGASLTAGDPLLWAQRFAELECLPNLRVLDLSHSPNLTDDALLALLRRARDLEVVFLEGCTALTNQALVAVGRSCPKLLTIDLSWCTQVDHRGLAHLLSVRPLERLGARGLGRGWRAASARHRKRRSGRGRGDAIPEDAERPSSRADGRAEATGVESTLGGDYAWGHWRPSEPFGVTDGLKPRAIGRGFGGKPWLLQAVMSTLVEIQPALLEVDLEAAVGVTDATIINLVRNSLQLRRLRASHCDQLTAASTTALALFGAALEEVVLAHCDKLRSPLVDAAAARSLARQTGLDKPAGSAPDPIASFGAGYGVTAEIRQQERLGSRQSGRRTAPGGPRASPRLHAGDLGDEEDLSTPPPVWYKLRRLDLTGCSGVWERDVMSILEDCSLLEDVRLAGLHLLTDYTFDSFFGTGPQLRSLSLRQLPALSDAGMDAITRACPNLVDLDVSYCSGFSDRGLEWVAERLPNLERFRANHCSRTISLAGILKLARQCRALRVLHAAQLPEDPPSLLPSRSGPLRGLHREDRHAASLADGAATALSTAEVLDLTIDDGAGVSESARRRPSSRTPRGGDALLVHPDSVRFDPADSSFDGDLMLFLLCLALCCPFLEDLDLSRRVPRGGLRKQDSDRPATPTEARSSLTRFFAPENDIRSPGAGRAHTSRPRPSSVFGTAPLAESADLSVTRYASLAIEQPGETHEVVFPFLARLALRHAGFLDPRQARLLLDTSPRLDFWDLTGCAGISLAHVRALAAARSATLRVVARWKPIVTAGEAPNPTVAFAAPSARSEPRRPGSTGGRDPRPESTRSSQPSTTRSVEFADARGVVAGARAAAREPGADEDGPSDEFEVLRLEPVPYACLLRESGLVRRRLAIEQRALLRIRRLVRHGLRREKQIIFTILWRIEVKREARRQAAARVLQRALRGYVKYMKKKRRQAASVIQAFWRRALFVRRCQERIRRALDTRRDAQMKRLAAALLLLTYDRAWRRITFERLRLAALVGRWEDERQVHRLRGLQPEYDAEGRFRVQFVLPEGGPTVMGEGPDPFAPHRPRPVDDRPDDEVADPTLNARIRRVSMMRVRRASAVRRGSVAALADAPNAGAHGIGVSAADPRTLDAVDAAAAAVDAAAAAVAAMDASVEELAMEAPVGEEGSILLIDVDSLEQEAEQEADEDAAEEERSFIQRRLAETNSTLLSPHRSALVGSFSRASSVSSRRPKLSGKDLDPAKVRRARDRAVLRLALAKLELLVWESEAPVSDTELAGASMDAVTGPGPATLARVEQRLKQHTKRLEHALRVLRPSTPSTLFKDGDGSFRLQDDRTRQFVEGGLYAVGGVERAVEREKEYFLNRAHKPQQRPRRVDSPPAAAGEPSAAGAIGGTRDHLPSEPLDERSLPLPPLDLESPESSLLSAVSHAPPPRPRVSQRPASRAISPGPGDGERAGGAAFVVRPASSPTALARDSTATPSGSDGRPAVSVTEDSSVGELFAAASRLRPTPSSPGERVRTPVRAATPASSVAGPPAAGLFPPELAAAVAEARAQLPEVPRAPSRGHVDPIAKVVSQVEALEVVETALTRAEARLATDDDVKFFVPQRRLVAPPGAPSAAGPVTLDRPGTAASRAPTSRLATANGSQRVPAVSNPFPVKEGRYQLVLANPRGLGSLFGSASAAHSAVDEFLRTLDPLDPDGRGKAAASAGRGMVDAGTGKGVVALDSLLHPLARTDPSLVALHRTLDPHRLVAAWKRTLSGQLADARRAKKEKRTRALDAELSVLRRVRSTMVARLVRAFRRHRLRGLVRVEVREAEEGLERRRVERDEARGRFLSAGLGAGTAREVRATILIQSLYRMRSAQLFRQRVAPMQALERVQSLVRTVILVALKATGDLEKKAVDQSGPPLSLESIARMEGLLGLALAEVDRYISLVRALRRSSLVLARLVPKAKEPRMKAARSLADRLTATRDLLREAVLSEPSWPSDLERLAGVRPPGIESAAQPAGASPGDAGTRTGPGGRLAAADALVARLTGGPDAPVRHLLDRVDAQLTEALPLVDELLDGSVDTALELVQPRTGAAWNTYDERGRLTRSQLSGVRVKDQLPYYASLMARPDMVRFRRAFDARVRRQQRDRALWTLREREAALLRELDEWFPCFVADRVDALERALAAETGWLKRWEAALAVMQAQLDRGLRSADLNVTLRRATLELRASLLRARVEARTRIHGQTRTHLALLRYLRDSWQPAVLGELRSRIAQEDAALARLQQEEDRTLEAQAALERLLVRVRQAAERVEALKPKARYKDERAIFEEAAGQKLIDQVAEAVEAEEARERAEAEKRAAERAEEERRRAEWEAEEVEVEVEVEEVPRFPWEDEEKWTVHTYINGKRYWFNHDTQTPQWEEPTWPPGTAPPPVKVWKTVKRPRGKLADFGETDENEPGKASAEAPTLEATASEAVSEGSAAVDAPLPRTEDDSAPMGASAPAAFPPPPESSSSSSSPSSSPPSSSSLVRVRPGGALRRDLVEVEVETEPVALMMQLKWLEQEATLLSSTLHRIMATRESIVTQRDARARTEASTWARLRASTEGLGTLSVDARRSIVEALQVRIDFEGVRFADEHGSLIEEARRRGLTHERVLPGLPGTRFRPVGVWLNGAVPPIGGTCVRAMAQPPARRIRRDRLALVKSSFARAILADLEQKEALALALFDADQAGGGRGEPGSRGGPGGLAPALSTARSLRSDRVPSARLRFSPTLETPVAWPKPESARTAASAEPVDDGMRTHRSAGLGTARSAGGRPPSAPSSADPRAVAEEASYVLVPRSFRPARADPTPRNRRYYSSTGDGEDIGNPGFWYWGRDRGVVYGLFGVRHDFGVVGERDPGEDSEYSSGNTDDEEKDRRRRDELEAARKNAELSKRDREKARLERIRRAREARRQRARGLAPPLHGDAAAASAVEASSSVTKPHFLERKSGSSKPRVADSTRSLRTVKAVDGTFGGSTRSKREEEAAEKERRKRRPPPLPENGFDDEKPPEGLDLQNLDFDAIFGEDGVFNREFAGVGGALMAKGTKQDYRKQRVVEREEKSRREFVIGEDRDALDEDDLPVSSDDEGSDGSGGGGEGGGGGGGAAGGGGRGRSGRPSSRSPESRARESSRSGSRGWSAGGSRLPSAAGAPGSVLDRARSAIPSRLELASTPDEQARLERRRAREEEADERRRRRHLRNLLDLSKPLPRDAAVADFPMEEFPGVWEELVDDNRVTGHGTGRKYYFHVASEATMWKKPTWAVHRLMEELARRTKHRTSAIHDNPDAVLLPDKPKTESKGRATAAEGKEEGGGAGASGGGVQALQSQTALDREKRATPRPRLSVEERARAIDALVAECPAAFEERRRTQPAWMAELARLDSPEAFEAEAQALRKEQAELDAADRPQWWREALEARDPGPDRFRGFGGGVAYARTADALLENLTAQLTASDARKVQRAGQYELALSELRRFADAALDSMRRARHLLLPGIVRAARVPVARTSAAARSREAPAPPSESVPEDSFLGSSIALPSDAPLRFEVHAPDGGVLPWAQDGVGFAFELWRGRVECRPWLIDAAIARRLESTRAALRLQTTGARTKGGQSASESLREAAADVLRIGGPALLRELGLRPVDGDRGDAGLSGFAAARARVQARQAEAQRAHAEAIDADGILDEALDEDDAATPEAIERALARRTGLIQPRLAALADPADPTAATRGTAALPKADALSNADVCLHGYVRNVQFSFGWEEASHLFLTQRRRFLAGVSFWTRLPPGVNLNVDGDEDDVVFVWVERTRDPEEALSHVELALNPEAESLASRRDLAGRKKDGWEPVRHNRVLPQQTLWVRRGAGAPISNLRFVLRREEVPDAVEETRLRLRRVEGEWVSPVLPRHLALFVSFLAPSFETAGADDDGGGGGGGGGRGGAGERGASDARRRKKEAKDASTPWQTRAAEAMREAETEAFEGLVEALEARLHEAQENAARRRQVAVGVVVTTGGVEEHGASASALSAQARALSTKLQSARARLADLREEQRAATHGAEDQAFLNEFLNLPDDAAERLRRHFRAMDGDLSGFVELPELFASVGVPQHPLAVATLESLHDRLADGGRQLDFPTFLRTVGVLCVLGPRELLGLLLDVVGPRLCASVQQLREREGGRDGRRRPPSARAGPGSVFNRDGDLVWDGFNLGHFRTEVDTEHVEALLCSVCLPSDPDAEAVHAALEALRTAATSTASGRSVVRVRFVVQLFAQFPSLWSPVLTFQMGLRRHFLGAAWWERQQGIFSASRSVLWSVRRSALEGASRSAERAFDRTLAQALDP